jgi:hypothetical protein
MRRLVVLLSCLVLVLAACGSDKKQVSTSTTSTTASTPTTPDTTSPSATSPPSTSVQTTAAPPCPNTGPTGPHATAANQPAALLTAVAVTTAGCRDTVTFTFKPSGAAAPSCTVEYRPGPFSQDGSGQPVAVAGTAFVAVRCEPAYGYDFANGMTTYTGPKRITPSGTRHVRQIVETGDFEGVLNWAIGLDGQRAFGITGGGVPTRQLVITFS